MKKTETEARGHNDTNRERDLSEARGYLVVKSNDLIQKSRFSLSTQEQKIILYLISKIKPDDVELKYYSLEIAEFCEVCGLDARSGGNYKYVKDTIKSLSDKSLWVSVNEREEILLRWIYSAKIIKKSGIILIRISDDIKPYLLQLKDKFTQYELLYTLAMKSQYSIRIYELLKSYSHRSGSGQAFEIEDLKRRLGAETYQRFADFKRKVLDIAMREINEISDLSVIYSLEKKGRKFVKITFNAKLKKTTNERIKAWMQIEQRLGGL